MSLRIKKGDLVMVRSGKAVDKGQVGRVLEVFPKKGSAIVEGRNIIKKAQRARNQQEQGGIIEREAPLPLSKLMLVDPKGQQAARFGVKLDDQGNKVRVLKLRDQAKEITV